MEAPDRNPYGVILGGEEEAWLYREAMRQAWKETPGALELLAAVPGEARRKRRRRAARP